MMWFILPGIGISIGVIYGAKKYGFNIKYTLRGIVVGSLLGLCTAFLLSMIFMALPQTTEIVEVTDCEELIPMMEDCYIRLIKGHIYYQSLVDIHIKEANSSSIHIIYDNDAVPSARYVRYKLESDTIRWLLGSDGGYKQYIITIPTGGLQ